MNDIEDRLAAAADRLRRDVDAGANSEAALERLRSRSRSRARSTVTPWLVAAVVLLVAGAVAVLVRTDDMDDADVRVEDDTASVPSSVGVPSSVAATTPGASVPTSTTAAPMTTTTGPSPESEDDLVPSAPGLEVTFEGAAGRNVGDRLELNEVQPFEGQASCGYWGPQEPLHSGEPQPPSGLAKDTLTTPTITTVLVHEPTSRTVSGVGIGTTLASLQRVYGERLVVDRMDGWETPTEGLLALYQDVAAVKQGDRAITFILVQDRVASIKISEADFWGDDEGCA